MVESNDIKYMRRCLELAVKAVGLTYPNPMVGAVIVHNEKIIGEGYHLKAGGPHAEVIAVNAVRDKSLLKDSTLYVNLEPCSHFGKTPPCADLIISCSIPEVVIGTVDTSNKVAGKGIAKLIKAGCIVRTGILEEECRFLNRRFFTSVEKGRPYIILKWAQSADGFLDILRKKDHKTEPEWITGNPERVLVHKWRSCEQSILVGAGTVRADNPKLNVREWSGPQPLRIVLSRSGLIDNKSAVFGTNGTFVVFIGNDHCDLPDEMKIRLDEKRTAAEQILQYLHSIGIQSLFVEGGAEVLGHFINTGYWDEARVFTGNLQFGDGIKAPELKNEKQKERFLYGNSVLNRYLREVPIDTK